MIRELATYREATIPSAEAGHGATGLEPQYLEGRGRRIASREKAAWSA